MRLNLRPPGWTVPTPAVWPGVAPQPGGVPTVVQIQTPTQLQRWRPQLETLLSQHLLALQDAFGPFTASQAVTNLANQLPHVWLAVDEMGQAIAAASLSEVQPYCRATVHGVSRYDAQGRPVKHPIRQVLVQRVLQYAFQVLRVYRLEARYDADNQGARGFCLRWGFRPEAMLRGAVLKPDGRRLDSAIWCLLRPEWEARQGR